jgi:hypothetical protein
VRSIPPYRVTTQWGFVAAAIESAVCVPALECDEFARESIAQTSFAKAITHSDAIPVWIKDPLWCYVGLIRKPSNYLREIEVPNWIQRKKSPKMDLDENE